MANSDREIISGDQSEADDWAAGPRRMAERLPQIASARGFDLDKLMQGLVLATIVDDDRNVFMIRAATFSSDLGEAARRQLLERMDWEMGVPELPEGIREKLKTLKSEFESGNWRSPVAYDDAKSKWHEMHKFVQDEMDRNPQLEQAYLYFTKKYSDEELREAFD